MILLLGSTGYVGTAYRRFFDKHKIQYIPISRADARFDRREVFLHLLYTVKPTLVINCAGYSGSPNVDAAELNKLICLEANTILPAMLADVCANESIPLGHVSSGCIYTDKVKDLESTVIKFKPNITITAGEQQPADGYTEHHIANFTFRQNNCSFYSGSKAMAEELMSKYDNCYLWRLRLPFNEVHGPRNYLSKLMTYDRLLDARNSLSQIDDYVKATWHCWVNRVPFGTYNVVNPGSMTTRQITELIAKIMNKNFKFFANEAEFMSLAAKAPRSNCVLNCNKLKSVGVKLPAVEDAITMALDNWRR